MATNDVHEQVISVTAKARAILATNDKPDPEVITGARVLMALGLLLFLPGVAMLYLAWLRLLWRMVF